MTDIAIAAKNRISKEQASEYDFIIVIDKSGSMSTPSTKLSGKTRWDEAEEMTLGLANFAGQVDEDGITVITFNSSARVYDNVTASKVHDIFTNDGPNGGTALVPALNEVFKKQKASSKKTMALIITDGESNDGAAAAKAIIAQANSQSSDDQLSIQFIQIGNDPAAARFLQSLDDDLQAQGAKFDIVNTMSNTEAEALTIEEILWLAQND